jgi:hypothetical protein
MQPENSLLSSEELAAGVYFAADKSTPTLNV